jgi:pimeloyl-ACP methyl ester carboxylesterase
MPHLELERARLFYTDTGTAAPPLVLVHGFGCAHSDWQGQVDRFGTTHRVVTPDLRCHGASTGLAADCTIETFGRDIAALIRVLELKHPVLVGHSMGCRVVLQAFVEAPERIGGLVLLDGSRLGEDASAEANTRQLIEFMGYPEFARALFAEALLPPTKQGRLIVDRAARLDPEVGLTLFPSIVRWDATRLTAALDAVCVPLLAIQSTYLNIHRKRVYLQPGQSSPWLDLVKQRVAGARTEIVPKAGHFTMLDAPEAVNRLLETVLETINA